MVLHRWLVFGHLDLWGWIDGQGCCCEHEGADLYEALKP